VKGFGVLVLPGDGIGPEIVGEARKVLELTGKKYEVGFSLNEALVGGASIDAHGVPLTDEVMELALESEAVLLGALFNKARTGASCP
jgi:3-isopropylmalate dehydrogenase